MRGLFCFITLFAVGHIQAQRSILEEAAVRKFISSHHLASVKITQAVIHQNGNTDTSDFEREYDKICNVFYYDSTGALAKKLNVDGGRDFITTYHYDQNGLLVNDSNVCAECPTIEVETFMYDADGRPVEYCKTNYDSAWRAKILKDEPNAKFGCVNKVVHYSYKGKRVNVVEDDCGKKRSYSYREVRNDTGAYTSRVMITAFGNAYQGSAYFYDDQHRVSRIELYDKHGDCGYQEIYTYNANGLPDRKQTINGKTGEPQAFYEEYYTYTFYK